MSGPIIRKYGFPNFEKIFGDREIKHGAPPKGAASSTPPAPIDLAQKDSGSPPGADATNEQKISEDSAQL